jgi:hypothetical protein
VPEFGFCGGGVFEYAQLISEEFWKEICELDFNVSRNSPLELFLTDLEDLLSFSDAPHMAVKCEIYYLTPQTFIFTPQTP